MTAVENIAWIVIIVAAIKMVVLLINPGAWMNLTKKFASNKGAVQIVSLVLGAVVLYYILPFISIVQLLAAMAFFSLLLMLGLAGEMDYFLKKYQAMIKKGSFWREYWLYTLIWIALLVWGAKELLA